MYCAHAREGLTLRWCHFYKVNAYFYHNSNQTSTARFVEPEQLTLGFIWTSKGSELAKKIWKYKTGEWDVSHQRAEQLKGADIITGTEK